MNPSTRYGGTLITLHWLTVILVAAAYVLMEFKGVFPKGSDARSLMKTLHTSVGITVLALTLIRLGAHPFNPAPAIIPEPPRWQQAIGRLMHWTLYAWLIVLPILGWLALNAKGTAIDVWGIPLPTLIGSNQDLSRSIKDAHELIAVAGYWLIGLHAAAALYHHYMAHDNTLRRMLPGRAPESGA